MEIWFCISVLDIVERLSRLTYTEFSTDFVHGISVYAVKTKTLVDGNLNGGVELPTRRPAST